MTISNLIENFIIELLEEQQGYAEIGRNELSKYFRCVPSQINYVIATRFSNEKGFAVESRRGGGGYIKIRKLDFEKSAYIMHIINGIGDSLSADEAKAFINNFKEYGHISVETAGLMLAATGDKALPLPIEIKDNIRAQILKNMLASLL